MNYCPIKSHTIQNICEQYDLTNLIKESTCYKRPTPSLLDIILVFNPRHYASSLNIFCGLSDFHDSIGAATKRFAPSQEPRIIHYRSFKKFTEPEFLYDIACAPFHVMESLPRYWWHDMVYKRTYSNYYWRARSNEIKNSKVSLSAIYEFSPAENSIQTEYGQKQLQEIRESLLGRKSSHKKACR